MRANSMPYTYAHKIKTIIFDLFLNAFYLHANRTKIRPTVSTYIIPVNMLAVRASNT